MAKNDRTMNDLQNLININQFQHVAYLYCRGLKEVKRDSGMGNDGRELVNFLFEKEKALGLMKEYPEKNISAKQLFDIYFRLKNSVINPRGGEMK